jgi:hypothetical protein
MIEELKALEEKATQEKLADGGRYFEGSCDDLTKCRHYETGEYQNEADGKLIEALWNNLPAILSALEAVPVMKEALLKIAFENCEYTTGERHSDAIWIARQALAALEPKP